MGVIQRRARQKEVLRNDILDAARQLFAGNGYDAVSTTIYLHFADKRDL